MPSIQNTIIEFNFTLLSGRIHKNKVKSAGRHHVSVREHRTAHDWAEEIKYMVDVMYPDAEKIILVMV